MQIAVFSDSHGDTEGMCAVIDEYRPDMVLHLGDCVRDAEELERRYPQLPLLYVRGNCDAWDFTDAPEQRLFTAGDVVIYMTHGHRQSVKLTLDALANAVHFSGAKLGLFGHTHQAEYKVMGDVTLFNPGSVGMGRRTWGRITVKGTEFKCELMKV